MTVENESEDAKGAVADRAKERRERAQARARKDILEAALRAFEASSYRDTKMADIAAEAGYTAASLYTYFASKQDIIRALADMLVDEVVNAWGPVPEPSPKPVDFGTFALRLAERVRGVLAHIDRRSHGLAFFMKLRWSGEADVMPVKHRDPCSPEGEAHENKIRARLAAVLEGIGLRHVSKAEPDYVAAVFGGMVEAFVIRGMTSGIMPNFAEQATKMTDFLLYGIRGER